MTGLPKMGTIGLGRSRVSGRTRVPCPAAKIMPFAIAALAYLVAPLPAAARRLRFVELAVYQARMTEIYKLRISSPGFAPRPMPVRLVR